MRTLKALIPFIVLIPLTGYAQTPEQKGLAIAIEADKRDTGFGDSVAELTMELSNKNGDTSIRVLRTKTLEVQNDGDKSMSIFDKPADVKGTAMLTFTHPVSADDQWLYLPALRRVKRISSANKSGPFMGSEFAYEDLSGQEVDKYHYRWLRDETYNDVDCFVTERVPVYENSGYTREVVWIDKAEYRVLKVEFYDRKNALLKTLTAKNYEKYLNHYWRAMELVMVNHQTGKMTRLAYDNYRFRTGLSKADFNKNALKRAR
jgi:outer membrane lipoprotein-sorting protein